MDYRSILDILRLTVNPFAYQIKININMYFVAMKLEYRHKYKSSI